MFQGVWGFRAFASLETVNIDRKAYNPELHTSLKNPNPEILTNPQQPTPQTLNLKTWLTSEPLEKVKLSASLLWFI